MNKTDIKLQYNVCENKDTAIPVIIVAAGSSTRMKGINKQFMPVLGVPVIARTLMAFERCADISKIILVTSRDSILDMQLICEKYMISKITDIIAGGDNRHQSVMKGMERLGANDLKVLVHDGARPFVDTATISAVARSLENFDAVLCVSKINDTVKKVTEDGVVLSTVDRSMLYSAQTPQGVDVVKYKNACNFLGNVEELTDDASVMEAAGYSVKAIIGSGKNIKITTPDDIAIAEALVKGESEL
ncbi:MAG: 2-C-methyl-D-erythritol 4-phosphate cytidylyltransferase [Clostridia bacterium]|nr:2-C-methyl-D-erythritol 4-phosphate cytidylyltransferase [Clostridia bacterium]